MPLIYVDRFRPQLRRRQQSILDAGNVYIHDEVELLEAEMLKPLAALSLKLLCIGSVFFVGLNIATYFLHTRTLPSNITFWGIVLWLAINIIGYIIIVPVHEVIHGLAFFLWGGKPHFGAKLPFALYCGARNQVFCRNQYLVVGLAPLVVITLIGIILTVLIPVLTSYVLLALAGNVAGAAGDVWVAARVWRMPKTMLVEDTEVGYRAWKLGGAGGC